LGLIALLACHPDPASILGADPASRFEVRGYRMDGSLPVFASPLGVVAHDFSSLHAVEWGDELVVVGLRADPPTWWEERFPSLFVDAIVTRDGRTWTARRFDVDAPGRSLLDPAIVAGPDGMELWFARAEGLGDPARRRTEIVRTRWDGARFGDAEVWYAGEGVVDPAPVWWRGAWHLFATKHARDVVRVHDGREAVVLPGTTVPFVADASPGSLMLVTQAMVDGRMGPRFWTWDGAAAAPAAVMDTPLAPETRTCASPVTGETGPFATLLCVDEKR
jgi:hypothetical protein